MTKKFESLEKFIKLSNEESKRFFGGAGTKIPSAFKTKLVLNGKTSTVGDLDNFND